MYKFALQAEKGNCEAKEATLGCENFDSGILKTIEWYLKKYNMKERNICLKS
jgi:dTDP-D-glucose 4,6-dehydratase